MKQFLFAATVALFASCSGSGSAADETAAENATSSAEKKVKILKEEVMAAHDRVMPAMNPMGKQQKRLRELAQNSADSVLYRNVAIDLKNAQEQMMNWMREFQSPDEQNWNEAQKAEYLSQEKAKMIEIEMFTFNTMHIADSIIEVNEGTAAESN